MAPRRIPVLALLALGVAAAPASSSHGGVRDKSPSWSPDGSLIAFSKSGSEFDQIWIARTNGTGHRRLSAPGARDTQPAWSPDGRLIAFASFVAGNWDVYVMDADGGNRRPVVAGAADETSPAWSPDGSRIAYQRGYGAQAAVSVVSADGSADRIVGPGEHPSWSPEGDRLVLVRTRDLYVVNADGSDARRLTSTPDRREDDPAWSPDGRRIAFAAGADYVPRDIYVADADGANERRITRLGRSVWWPRWSPGGSRLVFFEFPFPGATLYLVNADGSGLTPLFGRLAFGGLKAGPVAAGRKLTVVLRAIGAGAEAKPSCRASVAGRPLRLLARTLSGERARCVWAVPRGAQGKRVRGMIAVAERGARVVRAFSVRVRRI